MRTPIYPDQKHLRPHFAVTCVGSSSLGRSDGPAGGGERAPGGAQLLKRERRKEGRKEDSKGCGVRCCCCCWIGDTTNSEGEEEEAHGAATEIRVTGYTHKFIFVGKWKDVGSKRCIRHSYKAVGYGNCIT